MLYVGQKVVCVDARYKRYSKRKFAVPKINCVYTVRWIGPAECRCADINVRLYEIDNPIVDGDCSVCGASGIYEPHFRTSRFRPLLERKTDISAFKELLNKVPEKVEL